MIPRSFSRDDLGRAVRFFGECNRLTGLRGYMHTGDFLHFLSNGLRGRDPSRHVWPDHVSRSGLFEPVGCHKDFRRLGLSRALLHEGMRRLRSQGIDVAVVEPLVPAQNPAAYALYESVGFRPQCGWLKYRKTLPV